jgi:hypothetical protein
VQRLSRQPERQRKRELQERSLLVDCLALLFHRLIEGMIMCCRTLAVGWLAALAAFTWTAVVRAGDPEQPGPSSDLRPATIDADSTPDTVLVGHRGGFGFHHSSPGFYHPSSGFSFGRSPHFDNRFSFRRFDRIEDRLEARLRRTNPALFRRFDRIEDRLEAQLRRTNPFLFRRFDRIEDRLEGRFPRTTARSTRFDFPAFGDPVPGFLPSATRPRPVRVGTLPAAPSKLVYRAYGE